MMRWIVRSSLQFRFIVVALGVGMLVIGATRVRDMPVDVFPEFAPPFVEVQTEGLGMSDAGGRAADHDPDGAVAEQHAGARRHALEDRPRPVGHHALLQARHRQPRGPPARERARRDRHPRPARLGRHPPGMLQPLSATSRVMKIGLSSSTMSLTDLSMIAYWTIRWRLMAVPGVANVNDLGRPLEAAAAAVRSREAARAPGDDRRRPVGGLGRARLRPLEVHRRGQEPGGRLHRDAPTSGSASTTSCPCSARPTWPR